MNTSTALSQAEFDDLVRDALVRLYDPAHLQTHPLARCLTLDIRPNDGQTGKVLRQLLIEAIEDLRPATPNASDARGHQILRLRYVEALEISEILARLAIGRSHYYRGHRRALDALISLLRERWLGALSLDPADDAAARAPDRASLPASLTSFVGRAREIAEITDRLQTCRLLTLTGPGGVGKTRLAVRLASDLREEYPDGVYLVELAPLVDPELVASSVASVLRIQQQPGEPIGKTLTRVLRRKTMLLILDNCEHLLDAASRLADDLLCACPTLRILATSRESLGITGEFSCRVPSLASPPFEEEALDAEHLGRFDAVRLFVDRASAVRPDFRLTAENGPAVAAICARLDGLPLAIELAAARVRVLSVEEIAQRLDNRFHLLTGGSRTAPPRQQTLAATIDWSYDLLSAAEQTVLCRLAVFARGWTLEAAEAVCADPAVPSLERRGRERENRGEHPAPASLPRSVTSSSVEVDEVLDLLTRLVDRSLVLVEAGREGKETRYRLLETIRQYTGEKLLDAGEAPAVRSRHHDYFLDLAERALPHLLTDRQQLWFGRLTLELDNLRAALDWSEADADVDRHLRLVGALGRFWHNVGLKREGSERAVRAVERCGWTDVRARALALHWAGRLTLCLGGYRTGVAWLEQSIALARQQDDRALLSMTLRNHAQGLLFLGEDQLARDELEESLAVARDIGSRRDVAHCLLFLGNSVMGEAGDDAEALRRAQEGLVEAEASGDAHVIAAGFCWLGFLALLTGDDALAERCVARYAERIPSTIDGFGGEMLLVRGGLAIRRGDFAAARERYGEALFRAAELGEPGLTIGALAGWAYYCLVAVDAREAAISLGAIAAYRSRVGKHAIEYFRTRQNERDTAAVRAALGDDAFTVAWTEGQAMSLEQAVASALDELDALGEDLA